MLASSVVIQPFGQNKNKKITRKKCTKFNVLRDCCFDHIHENRFFGCVYSVAVPRSFANCTLYSCFVFDECKPYICEALGWKLSTFGTFFTAIIRGPTKNINAAQNSKRKMNVEQNLQTNECMCTKANESNSERVNVKSLHVVWSSFRFIS